MILLNAGNIWDQDYLDEVIRLNEQYKNLVKVGSLFGSLKGLTPTARAQDRLPYMEWNTLDRYVDKATENGIFIRYTLNQSCIGSMQDFHDSWYGKMKADVQELHNIGIHEWTVTSPLLVELLRNMFPEDFIEVSTIAEVATVEEAVWWKNLGADGISISTSINRSFAHIKNIVDTGLVVSILANEACLYRCPWRQECYNLSSHDSKRGEDLFASYPFNRCNEYRMKYPVEWVKSRMVLPQWMATYQHNVGVDWFKIAYRTHPKEVALPILRAYMAQEYKGNLLDLWPTIAHLGDTEEPADKTHVSCEKLDKEDFLGYFVKMGEACQFQICGKSCTHCYDVWKSIKGD